MLFYGLEEYPEIIQYNFSLLQGPPNEQTYKRTNAKNCLLIIEF